MTRKLLLLAPLLAIAQTVEAPKINDSEISKYWKDTALFNQKVAEYQQSLSAHQKQLLEDIAAVQQIVIQDQAEMAKLCGTKATFKADNADPRCEILPTSNK